MTPISQNEAETLFEQVSALREANGAPVGDEALRYVMPLLKGEQSVEENREMLLAMLARLEA